mmetsp:Transcript_39979/g.73814  ORF Transcript_39979/g.73814 Transcript_39979/m.73814 type:complete len:222 (-) Transcript_39979:339-1004(-)
MAGLKSNNVVAVPILFGTAAWALSIASTAMCTFVFRNSDNPENQFGLGLWGFEEDGVCRRYADIPLLENSLDTKMNAAKAFMFTTDVIGFFGMIFLCFCACFPLGGNAVKGLGVLMWLCTLFQGLTFLVYRAPVCGVINTDSQGRSETSASCSLDIGAKLAISATVCYFVAGVATCVVPSPPDEDSGEAKSREAPSDTKDVEAQPEQAKDVDAEPKEDDED